MPCTLSFIRLNEVTELLEVSRKVWTDPVSFTFVDLQNAFYFLGFQTAIKALQSESFFSVHQDTLSAVQRINDQNLIALSNNDMVANVKSGDRQVDNLFPKHFTATRETVMHGLEWEGTGVKLDGIFASPTTLCS